MTASTIIRAFTKPHNLISEAQKKDNHIAYEIKKLAHNLVTLGFGKSIEEARANRREKEVVNVAFDILNNLPTDYDRLKTVNDKILHTNFDKKYQIVQEQTALCLYTGKCTQSLLNGENHFEKDIDSKLVLKEFTTQNDLETFKNALDHVKSNQTYKELQSAFKIQSNFRAYIARHTNESSGRNEVVDFKIKRILYSMMKEVVNYFKLVPSAEKVNRTRDSDDPIARILRQNLEKSVREKRFGNCQEQAELLFHLIRNHPQIPDDVKKKLCLGKLAHPDDHAFVIIRKSDTIDDESIIIDPWLKFVDFDAAHGYRASQVIAKDKERGFFGSNSQYKKFLSVHEDGTYIEKNVQHHVVFDFVTNTNGSLLLFNQIAREILGLPALLDNGRW